MAQAAGTSISLAKLECATVFGGAWTDYSGFSATIAQSGGERRKGDYNTAGTDTTGQTTGPRDVEEYTLDIIYTEGLSDFWKICRTAFLTAAAVLYLRWSPKAGAADDFLYTSQEDNSIIIACPPPVGDFGSGDTIKTQIKIVTGEVNQSVIV